jgi:hypothetical protein
MPDQAATKQRWTNAERDALCERLASDYVFNNVPIDGAAVKALASMDGQAWRRRDKEFPSSYYKHAFVVPNQQKIDGYIALKRQRQIDQQKALEAQTAVEPARAQPPAEEAPNLLPVEQSPIEHPLPETGSPQFQPMPMAGSDMSLGQIVDAVMAQQLATALAEQAQQITTGIHQVLSEVFKSLPGFNNLNLVPRPDTGGRRVVLVAHADAKQLDSIRSEFPFLEIHGMDRDIPEGLQPDLVVGINLFGSDNLDKKLRKRFGRDYAPAFGGADGAKRVIRTRLVDPRLVSKQQHQLSHHH